MTDNNRQSSSTSAPPPARDVSARESSAGAASRSQRTALVRAGGFSRRLGAGLMGLVVGAGALFASGCLERPAVDLDPVTSNVFVNQVPINNIAAIDLLFLVDNSTSMADKQALLKQAVPKMVERLVTPDCVQRDDLGNVTGRDTSDPGPNGERMCPDGWALEFSPVNDIHIGVVTSSIGSHGYKPTCDEVTTNMAGEMVGAQRNDHGYLIPLVRPPTGPTGADGQPTYTGLSEAEPFLTWDGQQDVTAFGQKFANHVAAAGEIGCGFESQLEAFYRFLIEPNPYATIDLQGDRAVASTAADPTARDEKLLEQRKAFLRPSSLVAVVVLTDENDCSVLEGGKYYPFAEYGYLSMVHSDRMFAPTKTCETNPNDVCCDTCRSVNANPGCEADFAASCADKPRLPIAEDEGQERCFDQQRRFGFDLLFPVERYIDGLTRPRIPDSVTGVEVDNPLLVSPEGVARPTDLVFFAGIVGVPWQDLATPETLTNPNELSYQKTEDLNLPIEAGSPYNRWDVILGTPNHYKGSRFCTNNPTDESCGVAPVPPLDPFMIESIGQRTIGTPNPIVTAEVITAPGTWNNINGSEQVNEDNATTKNKNNDLQYACIFPLGDYGAEKDEAACEAAGAACDCDDEGVTKQRPLCRAPGPDGRGTGGLENAQYWGKAYPGLRVLQVLHGIRPSNAIVASICPKVSVQGASYGYNPAVAAIIDRLAEKLGGQCLPRQLDVDPDTGQVPCVVVETRAVNTTHPQPLDCTTGNNPAGGRSEVDVQVQQAIYDILTRDGVCYQEDTPEGDRKSSIPCSSYSMCQIQQLSGGDADQCLSGADAAATAGYCYVDPALGLGDEALVTQCSANEKRLLRFIPNNASGDGKIATPANDTTLFVACIGSAAVKVDNTP
jgi:hypothetical protein